MRYQANKFSKSGQEDEHRTSRFNHVVYQQNNRQSGLVHAQSDALSENGNKIIDASDSNAATTEDSSKYLDIPTWSDVKDVYVSGMYAKEETSLVKDVFDIHIDEEESDSQYEDNYEEYEDWYANKKLISENVETRKCGNEVLGSMKKQFNVEDDTNKFNQSSTKGDIGYGISSISGIVDKQDDEMKTHNSVKAFAEDDKIQTQILIPDESTQSRPYYVSTQVIDDVIDKAKETLSMLRETIELFTQVKENERIAATPAYEIAVAAVSEVPAIVDKEAIFEDFPQVEMKVEEEGIEDALQSLADIKEELTPENNAFLASIEVEDNGNVDVGNIPNEDQQGVGEEDHTSIEDVVVETMFNKSIDASMEVTDIVSSVHDVNHVHDMNDMPDVPDVEVVDTVEIENTQAIANEIDNDTFLNIFDIPQHLRDSVKKEKLIKQKKNELSIIFSLIVGDEILSNMGKLNKAIKKMYDKKDFNNWTEPTAKDFYKELKNKELDAYVEPIKLGIETAQNNGTLAQIYELAEAEANGIE